MPNFDTFLGEQPQDPEFKGEQEALELEFAIAQAITNARKQTGLTQKQLADKTGISQSDISKLEAGEGNPSVKTLQTLAEGMGMDLHIKFLSPADR